jgi:hypothetical protein
MSQKALFAPSVAAAADFLGNGAIEINRYETEIYDQVVRESVFLNRVKSKPATGHPHRYFEETSIGTAAFTDPRNIAPTATGPTRVEQAAFIKAITVQTNMSLFDVNVTKQQGQFAYLEAKDITDAVNAIIRLEAAAVWNGSDTSLSSPTTTQYVGLLTQIANGVTIGAGASIIDGLKTQVAKMVARTDYNVKPTAIYLNPLLVNYIEQEAKSFKIELGETVVGGVTVKSVNTQAGVLPLIPDRWLPSSTTNGQFGFSTSGSLTNYFAVIVTEDAVEMPYIDGGDGNSKPRVFQLGLLAGLQGQYVAVHFNAIIAKGASYSHATVCVQRV